MEYSLEFDHLAFRGAVLLESVYDRRAIASQRTKRSQDGSRF